VLARHLDQLRVRDSQIRSHFRSARVRAERRQLLPVQNSVFEAGKRRSSTQVSNTLRDSFTVARAVACVTPVDHAVTQDTRQLHSCQNRRKSIRRQIPATPTMPIVALACKQAFAPALVQCTASPQSSPCSLTSAHREGNYCTSAGVTVRTCISALPHAACALLMLLLHSSAVLPLPPGTVDHTGSPEHLHSMLRWGTLCPKLSCCLNSNNLNLRSAAPPSAP
jgi:hypothetical protein